MTERPSTPTYGEQATQKTWDVRILPHTGIFEGQYGNSTLVQIAVLTPGHTLRRSVVPVKDASVLALADAYAQGLQEVLQHDYPKVTDVTAGQLSLRTTVTHGKPDITAGIQFISNGKTTTHYATA